MSSEELEEAIAVAPGETGGDDDAVRDKHSDPVEAAAAAVEEATADTSAGGAGDVSADAGSDKSAEPADQSRTGGPRQGEMPFAMVEGKAFTDLPSDLYIPPDALEVILEAFEGPLDLLLYLIRRQNLDILEINVADITRQYMTYVDMMTAIRFELAAEYLVMAAMLAEIKSRMLLPRPPEAEEEEGEDPRAALIRRLQEYERFKTAAEDVDELPRMGRDIHQASAAGPDRKLTRPEPEVNLKEVLVALADVLRRADMFESHQVEKEKLSTRERMTQVLDKIRHRQFVPFVSLFRAEEGRLGVVVTFLAVMELVKESLVELVQNEAFGAIHVRARGEVEQVSDEPDGQPEAFADNQEDAESGEIDVFDEGEPETAVSTVDSESEVAPDATNEVNGMPEAGESSSGEQSDDRSGEEPGALEASDSEQEPEAETAPSLFSR
ncbi:segregation/condensation protein A [Microbulbifer hydrolyticus]|uniref:Segregation and condensation protein A n=1 Tax=Microbulbifer hydrolyticus TaxID=48074 RepID=A0A6P1TFI4_9GAMM|nr:segregation and condensation protein A [Microbulbifer hydrolyticus]QHQ39542.1 segregation/condensation protein A [Microbulbifer hydrolyticus]